MKSILTLGLLFSFNAFANCPNLTGDYICQKGSRISYKSIEQTETGYNIISDNIEFNYVTDGVTYELPATESVKEAKVTSYCDKNVFVVDFTAMILYEGSDLAKQVSKTKYSLKGDTLIYLQKTKMKGLPMPTVTLTCRRQ